MCGPSNEVGRPAGRRSECRPGPRRRNAAKAAGDSPFASRPRLPCLPPQAEFGRGFHPRIKDAECCVGATRWPLKSETRLVARKPSGRTKDYGSRTNQLLLLSGRSPRPARPDCAKGMDDSAERHYTEECQQG